MRARSRLARRARPRRSTRHPPARRENADRTRREPGARAAPSASEGMIPWSPGRGNRATQAIVRALALCLLASGCVTAVGAVAKPTALEFQLLGAYEELDRDLM